MGRYFLAHHLFYAKQVETAIAEARAAIELDPGFHHPYWFLGLALAALGTYDEAVCLGLDEQDQAISWLLTA